VARPGARPALLVALGVAVPLLLSACGASGGQGLAQQACVHVHRSVADYRASNQPGLSTAGAATLRNNANGELRAALPLAAAANSDDGSWNSLMTTLSESATVDEGHLVPALEAQCAVADSSVNVNPQSPSG
jgi:hypothetical protein